MKTMGGHFNASPVHRVAGTANGLRQNSSQPATRVNGEPQASGSDLATGPKEEAKLRKAAEDFEGLLLGQMLQSIRESALGGWQENHDQAGAVALEMAETQLAQVMASQGGLGIARTLQASMKAQNPALPIAPLSSTSPATKRPEEGKSGS
jgi:peptidoglycan hydrolase FlgJ